MSDLVIVAAIGVIGNVAVAWIGVVNRKQSNNRAAALADKISDVKASVTDVKETVNGKLGILLSNSKDAGNLEGRTELRQENKDDAKERNEK